MGVVGTFVARTAAVTAAIFAGGLLGGLGPAPNAAGATVVFSDGFEGGTLSRWSGGSGVVVQKTTVFSGAYAARARGQGTAAYAYKQLASALGEIYLRSRFRLLVKPATAVSLLRLKSGANARILSLNLTASGNLTFYNHFLGVERASSLVPAVGAWHDLQAHVRIAGTSSRVDVWLDGSSVAPLSRTDSLGTVAVGRVQIGEDSSGRTFDVVFDDVVASTGFVQAPVARSAPTVSGTIRVGSTLAASAGAWSAAPTPTFAYQWRRCNSSGGSCANIAGATSAQYSVVSADAGSTLRVLVTATNVAGVATATSAATAVVSEAPANLTPPSVSGAAVEGATLTAAPGSWKGTPAPTYAYRWQHCDGLGAGCADLVGATGTQYTLSAAEVGLTVRVLVTASNGAGSASAASAPVGPVGGAPVLVGAPMVAGTARDGSTLTASPGVWSGSPAPSYAYRWQRCDAGGGNCAVVGGATDTSYPLTEADIAATLLVVVTATNSVGSASASSEPVGPVLALAPANQSPPLVSGTAAAGETASATPGAWTGSGPLDIRYQWQRCDAGGENCADLAGEVADRYTFTGEDTDLTLRVLVTASNGAGSASAASAPVGPVGGAPLLVSAPVVAGTARDGSTLTASSGAWTGSPAPSYAYRWQRCDAGGGSCSALGGATESSYPLTEADIGATLVVVVTATNGAGSASASSEPVGPVLALAPANQSPPLVSGTAAAGETASATPGAWTGSGPLDIRYQWQRCDAGGGDCGDLADEVADRYTLRDEDTDRTVRVLVTASNDAGLASTASAPLGPVAAGLPPSNNGLPSISGAAEAGQTLTADPGSWTGSAPISLAYRWQRCDGSCVDIDGQIGSTYDVTGDDIGRTLRVVVTATNSCPTGCGSAEAASPASATVVAAPAVTVTAAGETSVSLSWTPIPGAVQYRVDWAGARANLDGVSWASNVNETTATTFVDRTLPCATSRTYTVVALNAAGTPLRTLPAVSGSTDACPAEVPPSAHDAFLFYYPWYSAPPWNSSYWGWFFSGSDIGQTVSALYPLGGLYSSDDPSVLDRQFALIKRAGFTVVVYSWAGVGDVTDSRVPLFMERAEAAGLKVAWMVEPYWNRQTTLVNDIAYINSHYGSSAAFYRTGRPGLFTAGRVAGQGLFFLWATNISCFASYGGTCGQTVTPSSWAPRLDAVHASTDGGILIANANYVLSEVTAAHMDGGYLYGQLSDIEYQMRQRELNWPPNAWFIPSITPGFDNRCYVSSGAKALPRADGALFDRGWKAALSGPPLYGIGVTSWNEWGESTGIEPTVYGYAGSKPGCDYLDFETLGSYGYLYRAQRWLTTFAATPMPESLDGRATVSEQLGDPNQDDGLYQLDVLDGRTVAAIVNGRPARSPQSIGSTIRYLYFSVDNHFAWQEPSGTSMTVSLTYLDSGGGTIKLQYDSQSASNSLAAQQVTLGDSGTWQTATWTLPNVYFGGRMNVGTDFRFVFPNHDTWVTSVSVSRN